MSDQQQNRDLHPKATQYIQELLAEKILLDQLKYPNAVKLLDQGKNFVRCVYKIFCYCLIIVLFNHLYQYYLFVEIERIENNGRAPPKEDKYVILHKHKPIRVTSRVLVPVQEYPKVICYLFSY